MTHILASYELSKIFKESSITDETLLQFAKELYKEGFIKANIEYDAFTDTNCIKYSITASKLESDNCESESNKQTGDNSSSDKKTKRNFLKSIFNI